MPGEISSAFAKAMHAESASNLEVTYMDGYRSQNNAASLFDLQTAQGNNQPIHIFFQYDCNIVDSTTVMFTIL